MRSDVRDAQQDYRLNGPSDSFFGRATMVMKLLAGIQVNESCLNDNLLLLLP